MNEQGQFTAKLLDSAVRAYAAGAAGRMRDSSGAPRGLLELWSFDAVAADMQVRIRHLAEALAVGRPEVFALDVQWLIEGYAARGVSVELVRTSLACLRDELRESLPAGDVRRTDECFDRAMGVLSGPPREFAGHLEDGQPHVELAREYLLALLEGRGRDAHGLVLEAAASGVSAIELQAHVVAPVQAEMGLMWQRGEVGVADEHLGSRIVEDTLALLQAQQPAEPSTGRTVITASVAGNLHDIGARVIAHRFEQAGWRSIFLGADMPSADLAQAVGAHSGQLVALSVGLGLDLRATAEAIHALRSAGRPLAVIVGGRLFVELPELWRDVGADGTAPDAEGALREGERLVDALNGHA